MDRGEIVTARELAFSRKDRIEREGAYPAEQSRSAVDTYLKVPEQLGRKIVSLNVLYVWYLARQDLPVLLLKSCHRQLYKLEKFKSFICSNGLCVCTNYSCRTVNG